VYLDPYQKSPPGSPKTEDLLVVFIQEVVAPDPEIDLGSPTLRPK
jgi:hypothetical protein